jgi:tetratricopeptide (TPR) repeat protein
MINTRDPVPQRELPSMKTIRIFISSPNDVATERDKARQVIADLQRRYIGNLLLEPVFWEDLPLRSDASFQAGIDYFLSVEHGVDIAVFILWSRLGSPLGAHIRKADGSEYLSGTEREWDLMLTAREASGGARPDIFTYVREDQDGFIESQRGKDQPQLLDMVLQQGKVKDFISEHFTDRKTGANTRAYFTFKEPITFAHRLRTHLRAELDQMLVDTDLSAVVWHPAEQGSPFRGLEVFEYEHAPLFFGREQEICDLQIRLRQRDAAGCAFVLLVGASGSGKSSLARAGVAPAVAQYDREDEAAEWRRAVFSPGENKADLLLGLVRALTAPHALPELAAQNLTELAADLARDPEMTFRHQLRPLFTGNRRRLLLIFDQIEELFTHGEITPEAQRQLGAALGALARSGGVWVLGTIRTDYYARFQGVPELLALKGEGAHVDLPPPAVSELQRIIIQPARAAGLRFEENEKDEPLDVRLLADATAHPEALPLLEFCLDALYQSQTARNDGVLRWADYEAMRTHAAHDDESPFTQAESGLAGALVSKAEEALASLPGEHQSQCLSAIFSKLLDFSAGERETPVRKTALEKELVRDPYHSTDAGNDAELPGARAFLSAFAERRLLVSGVAAASGGQEPPRTFTVAHEALLRNWPRLRQLQAEQAEFFRIRRQVERAQADWLGAKDDSFLLSEGLPLQLAEKLAAEAPELLTGYLSDYITRSAKRAERIKRRRRRTTTGVIAGLVLLAGLAVFAAITARIRQREAEKAKQGALASEKSERAQKEEAENHARVAKQTMDFMIGMFRRIDPVAAKGRDITVRELLDEASETVENAIPGQPAVELVIRSNLAHIYLKLGRPEQALAHAEASLRLAGKLPGDSYNVIVAQSLSTVGSCLDALGRVEEGLRKHEEALAMYQRLTEGDDPDVATSLSNVASSLFALGRSSEALPKLEEALAMDRRLFKGDHPAVALSLNNLAACLDKLGRSREALPILEEALAMDRRLFKDDRPDIASLIGTLANCLNTLGRNAEALPKFEEAFAMRRRLFQGDHPDLALSLNNLARCLEVLGRPAEALSKFEEARAMFQRIFKGDHPDVATSLNSVARCLDTLDRSAEALPKYEEALAMRQRLFKGDHSDVALSLNSLASCLGVLGRKVEALSRFEEVLAMIQRLFKGDHPYVASSLNNVARCLEFLDRSAEALPKYEEVLAMRQRLFDSDHRDVASSLDNVASCLAALDRNTEALLKYEEALAMRQRLFKGDHPDVAVSFWNVGDCLNSLERFEEAFKQYEAGREMLQRLGQQSQAVIWQVLPGSQAERLGLRRQDVILQYAGKPIFTWPQFVNLVGKTKGRDIEMKIRRGEEVLTFKVQEGRIGCVVANQTIKLNAKPQK